jgi:hypothetical protein
LVFTPLISGTDGRWRDPIRSGDQLLDLPLDTIAEVSNSDRNLVPASDVSVLSPEADANTGFDGVCEDRQILIIGLENLIDAGVDYRTDADSLCRVDVFIPARLTGEVLKPGMGRAVRATLLASEPGWRSWDAKD